MNFSTSLLAAATLAFTASSVAWANPNDSDETFREQQLAQSDEIKAAIGYPADPLRWIDTADGVGTTGDRLPLFVGLDNAALNTFTVDPVSGLQLLAFPSVGVWGAAYDSVNDRVYYNNGTSLYAGRLGEAPLLVGTIRDAAGAPKSVVGLAFHDGVLYATTNVGPEAIYIVNFPSLALSVFIDYDDAANDLGGLAIDHAGRFYATNDTAATRGLVRINTDGSVTLISPYPPGESDIDGLAIHADKAYLVTDDANAQWNIYSFSSNSYVGTFLSPYSGANELFSGAAWVDTIFYGGFDS